MDNVPELHNDKQAILDDDTKDIRFYTWALATPICLTTSRSLLVHYNYHYPLHLIAIQLVVAALWTYARRKWVHDTPSRKPSSVVCWSQYLSIALSLSFGAQAVLHSPNVATLAMIAVVAQASAFSSIFNAIARDQACRHIYRLLFIMAAYFPIMLGDYRVTINGLVFTTLSLASAMYAAFCTHKTGSIPSSDTGFYGMSIAAAAVGCFLFGEATTAALKDVRIQILPILVLNLVASSAVLASGRSWLLYLCSEKGSDGLSTPENLYCAEKLPPSREIAALLWLAAFTGLSSTMGIHRSYVSGIQLLSFLVGVVILDNGRSLQRIYRRRRRPLIESEEKHEHELEADITVGEPRTASFYVLMFVVVLLFTWTAFLGRNFHIASFDSSHHLKTLPRLDLTYSSPQSSEIVISTYHEPLHTVKSLVDSVKSIPALSNSSIHIYSKDPSVNVNYMRQQTGATHVTQLANVGREGETYLNHILTRWDHLAEHTLFIQGDVHNRHEFLARLKHYFEPDRTGFLSLGFVGNICDCNTCADRFGWSDSPTMRHFYSQIYSQQCDNILLSYKGQFIASARRIRGVGKAVYEELREALVNEKSWAHQDSYLQGREDSMDKPQLGYSLERMWGMLMQCNDMDVGWKCASLLGGTRLGGDKADCQCFDPART